jgi:hypothetical protein
MVVQCPFYEQCWQAKKQEQEEEPKVPEEGNEENLPVYDMPDEIWVLLRGPIKKYPEIRVCLIGALIGGIMGAMTSGDCSSVVCNAIAGCVFGTGGVVIKGKPEIVIGGAGVAAAITLCACLGISVYFDLYGSGYLKNFVNVYSEDHDVFPVFETGALGTLFRLLGREV